MIDSRKSARLLLKSATRAEYDKLIFAANLTPSQTNILNLHFQKELSIADIADKMNCSEGCVRKKLSTVYDKLAKL